MEHTEHTFSLESKRRPTRRLYGSQTARYADSKENDCSTVLDPEKLTCGTMRALIFKGIDPGTDSWNRPRNRLSEKWADFSPEQVFEAPTPGLHAFPNALTIIDRHVAQTDLFPLASCLDGLANLDRVALAVVLFRAA